MRGFAPSFRARIVVALMATVAGVLIATLVATGRSVGATYERMYRERFEAGTAANGALREARLAAVRSRSRELASSVRLIAALEENDPEILYRIALDELRDVIRPPDGERGVAFFRLADREDRLIPPTDERAGQIGRGIAAGRTMARAFDTTTPKLQQIGYVGDAESDPPRVFEVVRTAIFDPVTRVDLGALLLGFPVAEEKGDERALRGGLWIDGRLYWRGIEPEVAAAVRQALERGEAAGKEVRIAVAGVPHRLFTSALVDEGAPSRAMQVALYSLAGEIAELQSLRRQGLGIGALAMVAAFVTSLVLARGLSGPVETLVGATAAIRRGEFDVRVPVERQDELGRLAEAFNEMALGLAEKERVRAVLNLVADPAIAAELVDGEARLGGELRDVSILFCDIRGFTELTESMPPEEVIRMLNEHMSALTQIVHAHDGVVDKFVGDSLMALFGAPRRSAEAALQAVGAAVEIVAARARLNEQARIRIEIGVGVASGAVVAGCMGAADRLNYTVVGTQVNLAARLCGSASRGEVLIDETTAARVGERVVAEALPPRELKGFRAPMVAYRVSARAPVVARA